jgi:hypothetical protein
MKKAVLALAVVASLAPTPSFGLSRRVAQIFDRNQRVMDPPPKSMTADPEVRAGRKSLPREDEVDESRSSGEALATVPVYGAESSASGSSSRPRQRSRTMRRQASSSGYDPSDRVMGIGLVGAGAYGIFGAELEFVFNPEWTGGIGIGTGMAYSSWGVFTRYFFKQGSLSPFFQAGYSHWQLSGRPGEGEKVQPGYLAERFLSDKNGIKANATAHILYPGLGVLFQHPSGLGVMAQLQYFISAPSFQGAPAGSFGFYYSF